MYVPSIVFQHIPMREYYEVLKRVDRGEKGAVRAYRTHKNEYYKLGETCGAGDIFLEPPSVPDVNTGEFEALSECGEVLAAEDMAVMNVSASGLRVRSRCCR